jgi:hypothetical protein
MQGKTASTGQAVGQPGQHRKYYDIKQDDLWKTMIQRSAWIWMRDLEGTDG